MPNRIIKESVCVSRKINLLLPEEEVFYYRLLVNCDDYGTFFGDPEILSAKLFPRKRVSDDKTKKWRDKLAEVGLVSLYIVEEEVYINVVNWFDHQQQRAIKRKYPSPDEGHPISDDIRCNQMQADATLVRTRGIQSNPIQSESNPNPNTLRASRKTYGTFQNVRLTDEELDKLNKQFVDADKRIETLSGYIASKGDKYKSHYATIINWSRKDAEKPAGKYTPAGNFSQRDFDPAACTYDNPEEDT
jgi:hypothetical protein